MKKYLFLLLMIPFLGFSQEKTVVGVTRIFAKPEKSAELEKALTAHAQKFHTGDWKWRVFEIMSGPDAGGYHITEGPNSWTSLDTRGNLGAEHTADLAKNILPLTTGNDQQSYFVFRDDLSSVQPTDFADKISINHIYPLQGASRKVEAQIKRFKKMWESSGMSVAVYESHFSGEFQYAIVTRHKKGWIEKEKGYYKPVEERYDAQNGEGSYEEFLDRPAALARSWGELLVMRPDLSSK